MASISSSSRFFCIRSFSLLSSICVYALFTSSLIARTDLVMLTSGERIIGEVLPQSDDTTLVLRSELLGEISLPRARVAGIESLVEASSEVAAELVEKQSVAETAVAAQPTNADAEALEAEVDEREEVALYNRLLGFSAPDSWKGNVRMGMNISSGDSRWTETAVRGDLDIKEKGSRNFYRFTGAYTYRETEKNNGDEYKSTDRYDGTFTYRRSFEQDWFLQNALGARVDQIKGIDREIQDTIGVGYRYRPVETFEFLLGGGGGIEDYESTEDESRNGINPVMNVFQEFSWDPFQRTSVVQKFNYYWNPENSARYNYVVSAALRVRLTDLLGFEFSYNQNYDNDIGNGKPKDDAVWRNALIVYF